MKVSMRIDTQYPDKQVCIEAPEYSRDLEDLATYIKDWEQHARVMIVFRGERQYRLDSSEIVRLVIEDRRLLVKTLTETYHSKQRLYQVKEGLPSYFLQISQSEIINLNQLDHLQVTPNGLVKLIFNNQDMTYSSRRYLKAIKEALNL